MTKIVVWLLIATSNGYYNRGTVTVIGQFPAKQDCEAVKSVLNGDSNGVCVQATLAR